jgi:histidyl-tRNA synthetase
MSHTISDPSAGFPEFEPAQQVALERVKRQLSEAFERFGFVPLETSAAEADVVLTNTKAPITSAGSMDRHIYTLTILTEFNRLQATIDRAISTEGCEVTEPVAELTATEREAFQISESDSNEMKALKAARGLAARARSGYALHYDLTIPLVRYVSRHMAGLSFPFRRYQIQKVWRAGNLPPQDQHEYYHCDIDVVGYKQLDILTDAEIPSVIYRALTTIDAGRFQIRISNAKVLGHCLRHAGVPCDRLLPARQALNRLKKVGTEQTVALMHEATGISPDKARELIDFLRDGNADKETTVARLRALPLGDKFEAAVSDLATVVRGSRLFGVPDESIRIDLTIARELDYYTGTVYETDLLDHDGLGSICSGGRYDNLSDTLSAEETKTPSDVEVSKFPGVGVSFDLTRLTAHLFSADAARTEIETTAAILVISRDRASIAGIVQIANLLRVDGINTEVYLNDDSVGSQFGYANAKGFKIAVIAENANDLGSIAQLRVLATGVIIECSVREIPSKARQLLREDDVHQ